MGFEPTTSAESLVYGYLHALPNFLIPQFWSVFPIVMDSGARPNAELTTFLERSPGSVSSLARLRPRLGSAMSSCPVPHQIGQGQILAIKPSSRDGSYLAAVSKPGCLIRLSRSRCLGFVGDIVLKKVSTSFCLHSENLNFVSSGRRRVGWNPNATKCSLMKPMRPLETALNWICA